MATKVAAAVERVGRKKPRELRHTNLQSVPGFVLRPGAPRPCVEAPPCPPQPRDAGVRAQPVETRPLQGEARAAARTKLRDLDGNPTLLASVRADRSVACPLARASCACPLTRARSAPERPGCGARAW